MRKFVLDTGVIRVLFHADKQPGSWGKMICGLLQPHQS